MANRIAVLWRFIKVYVHTVIIVVVALVFAVCFVKVYVVIVIVFGYFQKYHFPKIPKNAILWRSEKSRVFFAPAIFLGGEECVKGGGVNAAITPTYFSERISAIFSSVNFSNAIRAFSVMSMNSPFSAKNSRQRILLVSPDVNKSAATFW